MSFPNRFPINTTSRNVLVMFRQKFWNRCGTCLIKIMTACFPWGSSVSLSIWWSDTEKARIFHQHFLVMSCLMNLCCLSRAHPILLIDLLVGELILVYLYTSCRHIFIVAKWGVRWLETCQNGLGWNMLNVNLSKGRWVVGLTHKHFHRYAGWWYAPGISRFYLDITNRVYRVNW